MLKHGILGLLNYGAQSGYEIMVTFRDSLSYFWTANTSQIYRELQTLKEKGFVVDQKVMQEGKPDKNVFSITESGRKELRAWLGDFSYGNANSGLMMKIFFAGELSNSDNSERFRQLKVQSLQYLERYQVISQIIERYKTVITKPEVSEYWKMTVDFGYRYNHMLIEWCDACMMKLESKGKDVKA